MNRQTLYNIISSAMTPEANFRAKMAVARQMRGPCDLSELEIKLDEARAIAWQLVCDLDRARDECARQRAAEFDASFWSAPSPVTEQDLRVIGDALANYRPRVRNNVIPPPSARRLELVSDSNGAV